MKSALILLAAAVIPGICQIVENPPLRQFQEFPHAELRNFSVGSYGFDARENRYNPHLDDSTSVPYFLVSIGGNVGLAGERRFLGTGSDENQFRNLGNAGGVAPNISLSLLYDHWRVQLSYTNDYFLRLRQSGNPATYLLNTDGGIQTVTTDDQEIKITQNTLQLTVSLLSTTAFSLTAGISTRAFHYRWDLKTIDAANFDSGLFNDFQYLFGTNFKLSKRLNSYGIFHTQKANVMLSRPEPKVGNATVSFQPAAVSYYGYIGYGLEALTAKNLNISLEMRHQFLEVSDTSSAAILRGNTETHLWNNEIIAGLNFQPLERLKLGFLYSYYLKYDSNLSIRFLEAGEGGDNAVSFVRVTNPYALALSGEYHYRNVIVRGFYQFASASYENHGDSLLKDTVSLISLSIGYQFSL